MMTRMSKIVRTLGVFLAAIVLLGTPVGRARSAEPADKERHFLYVVSPGIRNYLEFGGAGILVFDMDNGHKFVKRIQTPASAAPKPENIKGVCACAATKKLYFTTLTKLYCVDLVTAKTLCFVNVNGLLGFEIGDLTTGKKLHRVEVEGYKQGKTKRHGCPSHGVGLTPDEKEVWVCDAANSHLHVFDNTVMPPKQIA